MTGYECIARLRVGGAVTFPSILFVTSFGVRSTSLGSASLILPLSVPRHILRVPGTIVLPFPVHMDCLRG